jgi:hypothetical protein
MLGETAAEVFGFDREALAVEAERVGPKLDEMNTE